MLQILKLLIPALIPSWRFFYEIAPSPRIEYIVSNGNWQEFRPRSQSVSVIESIKNIFYNAYWNEYLYLINCAEKYIITPSPHCYREIKERIERELQNSAEIKETSKFQFRLVFVHRDKTELNREVLFTSELHEVKPK
ncbi:MAG: hypothetical protein MK033_01005 [Candidatus Caenarcaniphilales bacterium]|nr:hypothetical protein [Candidatus Caenarcaniphilales bacterium]